VDAGLQLRAWAGVQQGTDEWHRLRACRVTSGTVSVPGVPVPAAASNFGAVHRTNTYCSPADLLRQLLWPCAHRSLQAGVAAQHGQLRHEVWEEGGMHHARIPPSVRA
jgi:hypothetical protein